MKKCKSTGRAKGFHSCGKESEKTTFGLCNVCLIDWGTTTEGGRVWYEKVFLEKARKITARNAREKKKLDRVNLINWRKKLQTKVQEISRVIDVGMPCLALGVHANQLHGGHVWAKGSNTTQSLNLHNIHRQSAQSNTFRNDDGLLREKLAEEYGDNYLEFVRSLKLTPSLNWSNMDYHDFYKTACALCNELKRKGQRFDTKGRILMRNEINTLIGVYDKKQCLYYD